MARFLTRMMGLYKPEELLISIKVDKFTCTSPAHYQNVYVELVRGSHR